MKKNPPMWNFRSKRNPMMRDARIESNEKQKSRDAMENKEDAHKSLLRNSMKIMSPGPNQYQLPKRNSGVDQSRYEISIRSNSLANRGALLTTAARNDSRQGFRREPCGKHHKAESAAATSLTAPTSSSSKVPALLRDSKRANVKDLQCGPGPGAYYHELEIGGVSHVIGTSKRVHDRKPMAVGPGAYEIPPFASGSGYSMTPRRKIIKIVEKFPGPGSYSPSPQPSGVSFSVGRAKRVRMRLTESPGPGTYTLDRPSTSRSAL